MSQAARIVWMANRVRCMPFAEFGYRLRQAALGQLEQRGLLKLDGPAPHAGARATGLSGAPQLAPGEREALLADADHICAGHVTLFSTRRFDVGPRPEWNRDPDTGVLGPSTFSGAIPITRRELVGDIKHLWELNRHLHLVRLAQAGLLSDDAVYLRTLATQLRDWLDQCPPQRGPNWTSALEMGIRLINWSLIWQLTGGEASALFSGEGGAQLRSDWLASIHAHCRCLERHLSRHSSANNHLLGELAGLYVAASTWPCWNRSAVWREQAMKELEQQAPLQYSRDGVNREQAFAYHIFSTEFLLVAGLVGQVHQRPFSRAYWETLQRALRFLRSALDAGGHLPMVGDADDGMVFRLDAGNGDSLHQTLDAGGHLPMVGDADDGNVFRPHAGADGAHASPQQSRADQLLALGDELLRDAPGAELASSGARWLLHALPGPRPTLRSSEPEIGWAFPDGGYLFFGADFGGPHEIKGMLDCGPLGYLGIAAHGHADALALTLSVGGQPCLIDPGTYSYSQAPKWRDYFRGTSAHNTVRVDGLDQSVSGGRFMWLRHANTRIERMPQSPAEFDFRGSHDGYLRLPDPVRHLRSVRFDAASATLVVRDELAARKPHQLEQFWHFAPEMALALSSAGLHVRGRGFVLMMQFSGADLALELVRGAENPPLGWVSRGYEHKQPCEVLKITTRASTVAVECRITISFSP
jgi:hypothetical protein